ncbi:PPR domain-containing protein, partial [Cephalotus follicularis]
LYRRMLRDKVGLDHITLNGLLRACVEINDVEVGRELHCLVVKLGFDSNCFVGSALIGFYAKCGLVEDARWAFDIVLDRDIVLWNGMVALVNMYAKTKNIDDARKAFDGMEARNSVSWTTMIVGYGQHGEGKEAMRLLRNMFRGNFFPDELNLASVFSSCGNIIATFEIMQVHSYVLKNGFQAFMSVANALINSYSKCGILWCALQCFRSVQNPDIITWTSIVGAYAFHGLSKESIELFEHMLADGVWPDGIAFLGVLSACNHGGLVNEGLHYFNLMSKFYRIMPNAEHYTCIIDLLGRAGLLKEAFNILTSMPVETRSSDTFGAFIRACEVHGNAELAKWAAETIFTLDPNKSVNYTLMSNIYASQGNWFDAARIRKMMRDMCDYKIPACSRTEI